MFVVAAFLHNSVAGLPASWAAPPISCAQPTTWRPRSPCTLQTPKHKFLIRFLSPANTPYACISALCGWRRHGTGHTPLLAALGCTHQPRRHWTRTSCKTSDSRQYTRFGIKGWGCRTCPLIVASYDKYNVSHLDHSWCERWLACESWNDVPRRVNCFCRYYPIRKSSIATISTSERTQSQAQEP
jgi:hypothetical protein